MKTRNWVIPLVLVYIVGWPIFLLAEQKRSSIPEIKELIVAEYSEATGEVKVVPSNGNCLQVEFDVDITTDGEGYNLGTVELFNVGLIHTYSGKSCIAAKGARQTGKSSVKGLLIDKGDGFGLQGGRIVTTGGRMKWTGLESRSVLEDEATFTISSEAGDPLRFLLTDEGFLYLSGIGKVVTPSGTVYPFDE